MRVRLRWIVILACVMAMVFVSTALAAVYGTVHDFKGSTRYPNLARLAVTSTCAGCHIPRTVGYMRDFGNDFPGGVPGVTDPDYQLFNDEIGQMVGPRLNPDLPQAMRCLRCHDGTMRTPYGIDLMPAPVPGVNGPVLNWATGGAHNIWSWGQNYALHPVQMHYPAEPAEKMHDGFSTLDVLDNRVRGADGRWYIYEPSQSQVKLPLITDPLDPDKAYMSCITCHDPHDNSADADGNFKRLNWPELCFTCHQPIQ